MFISRFEKVFNVGIKMITEENLLKRAQEAIPIAEVSMVRGPRVDVQLPPLLGGNDIEVHWNVHILDRDMRWEPFMVHAVFREDMRNSMSSIEITMKRVIESYASTRDRVSHIDKFKDEYRKMLATVYGDPQLFKVYSSL